MKNCTIMKNMCFCVVIFVAKFGETMGEIKYQNIARDYASLNNTSLYKLAVKMGIIDPEKYTLPAFNQHERDIFRESYKDFMSLNITEPMSYKDWLIKNNFGLLRDTQESLFEPKILSLSSRKKYRRRFLRTVKQGDILITTKSNGPFRYHAAIMVTDYWVLDMAGGKNWEKGIRDNNRQLDKEEWYDLFENRWTTVYRLNYYTDEARDAAVWADRHYYNPTGGKRKLIHVTYKVTKNIFNLDPSYPSKLVIHAYYFATNLVSEEELYWEPIIIPNLILDYFNNPYDLENMGKF